VADAAVADASHRQPLHAPGGFLDQAGAVSASTETMSRVHGHFQVGHQGVKLLIPGFGRGGAMGGSDRYTLVFVRPGTPEAGPDGTDVVAVHRTDRSGPGGHPLYADDTGIVLAEISDRGEVRIIASGGQQDPATAVQALPA
jgi:hypothetical protein